jgi:hypothetical protein
MGKIPPIFHFKEQSALGATTEKNFHNAEQNKKLCEPFSTFKGTAYLN